MPLFQSECKCETILMKMTLICMKMKLHAELIFIWMVSHLDSFWNRGTRELGNGLLTWTLFHGEKVFQFRLRFTVLSGKYWQLQWLFRQIRRLTINPGVRYIAILGDPGAVGGAEKKFGRRKVKNDEKSCSSRRSWLFFARIFSCPFRLFPAPTNCPWVSEDDI